MVSAISPCRGAGGIDPLAAEGAGMSDQIRAFSSTILREWARFERDRAAQYRKSAGAAPTAWSARENLDRQSEAEMLARRFFSAAAAFDDLESQLHARERRLSAITDELNEGTKGMRVLADVLRAIGCTLGSRQAADWADRMTEYAIQADEPSNPTTTIYRSDGGYAPVIEESTEDKHVRVPGLATPVELTDDEVKKGITS